MQTQLREHVVTWLAGAYPESLPRMRAYLEPYPGGEPPRDATRPNMPPTEATA